MANAMVLAPNFLDSTYYPATFTGGVGSWQSSLPLTNLKDPFLVNVARSTDATATNTQFEVNLGTARGIVGVAFPYSNVSLTAQIRIMLSNTSGSYGSPIADTGWQNWYPTIYPFGTLQWGDPSFWFGTMTAEAASSAKVPFWYIWTTPQTAQYMWVQINDTGNAYGYVDLPRMIIAPGYQPTYNISYGASITFESTKVAQNTLGGAEVFQDGLDRRVARLSFDYVPQDEALINLFDMARNQSINNQVFFTLDPATTIHKHRIAFLGRLRTMTGNIWNQPLTVNQTLEISEVVA